MPETPTHAMILAAGEGRRMRPLTEHRPKPLVPVAGKALIEYSLSLLEASHIDSAVVNASYLATMLESYLTKREGIHVHISHEAERLETGGGIAKALPLLGDRPFYTMNSDVILCDGPYEPALKRLAYAWNEEWMDALLLITPRDRATGYDGPGDFFLEPDGRLKRRGKAKQAPYVYTGTQILHPRLFTDYPQGAFSLNELYNRQMDESGGLLNIGGLVHDGGWLHVGTPEAILQAEAELSDMRACG